MSESPAISTLELPLDLVAGDRRRGDPGSVAGGVLKARQRRMSRPGEMTAFGYWGAMAERYDAHIRRVVPNYADLITHLLESLPDVVNHIVELGCGSGGLSLSLMSRYPEATVTFVDAAPEMVELTRARLDAACSETAGRRRFIVSRFEDLSMEPRSVDLVVANISLHHVEDKAALFRKIYLSLAPSGTLRFGDHFLFSNPTDQAVYWSKWLGFCRDNCSDTELDELMEHVAVHDHYTTVGEQLALLQTAGFSAPDCIWRSGLAAVVAADRTDAL